MGGHRFQMGGVAGTTGPPAGDDPTWGGNSLFFRWLLSLCYITDIWSCSSKAICTTCYCVDRQKGFNQSVAIGNPERHVRSFPPWQQATMEIMRCNLSYYCLLATRIYIVVLRAYPVRIIIQSTQHHRRGCNKSIRRTKEQQTRLQCLAWAMPKSAMPSGAIKSAKLLKRKSARIWQC